VLSTGHPNVREEWLMQADGSKACLEMLRTPYFDFDGAPLGLIGIGRDISERRRLEEQMRVSALVYQHTAEGMLVTDANYRIIDINAAGARITGYQLDEVRGQRPDIFNSGRQDQAFYEAMQRTMDEFGYWHGEVEDRRKNGDTYAKSMVINRLMGGDGTVHGYVMLFSDITEKKQADEMIWRQANFDMLTGLPNRRMLRERLEHEIRQAARAGCSLALLLIDLDHFKEINDTLGHLVGDDLLVEAARRISACTRESDTVARLGGDEFTVILTRVTDPKHVETVAAKIITHLAEPFQLGDSVAYISASVGITLCPDDAGEAEALLKNADQAMYVAKRQGRNRFSHFTQGLQTAAQDRLRMIGDLRSAIRDKQFHLHFQPIVDPTTGHICKAEALLRWDHPIHGVVLPGEFIPLAEETGMIVPIGDWVFREAARWASRWNRLVPGGLPGQRERIPGAVPPRGRRDPARLDRVPAQPRHPRQQHGDRDHRGSAAECRRRRVADPAGASHGRHPDGDRRLRNGLLLAGLSQQVRHRVPEDRPVVHQQPVRRSGRPRLVRGDHRDGPQAGSAGDRRRRGDRRAAQPASAGVMRLPAGLSAVQAHHAGTAGGRPEARRRHPLSLHTRV
jgi:diguanylate cyclase (GGDEF)-like protein/PAS domain S-box-containing protein